MTWIESTSPRPPPVFRISVRFQETGQEVFKYEALLDTGATVVALPGEVLDASSDGGLRVRLYHSTGDDSQTLTLRAVSHSTFDTARGPVDLDVFHAGLQVERDEWHPYPLRVAFLPPDKNARFGLTALVGTELLFGRGVCCLDVRSKRVKFTPCVVVSPPAGPR